jgi:hypothetical protein
MSEEEPLSFRERLKSLAMSTGLSDGLVTYFRDKAHDTAMVQSELRDKIDNQPDPSWLRGNLVRSVERWRDAINDDPGIIQSGDVNAHDVRYFQRTAVAFLGEAEKLPEGSSGVSNDHIEKLRYECADAARNRIFALVKAQRQGAPARDREQGHELES